MVSYILIFLLPFLRVTVCFLGARTMKGNSKFIIVIIVLVAIVFGLSIGIYYLYSKKFGGANSSIKYQQMIVDTRSEKNQDTDNPLKDRTVSFVGLNDAILQEGGVIVLENLPENKDFYMKYEVTDNNSNKVVFETDLIESGNHIDWVPSETMKKGEYHLSFLQIPFWKSPDGSFIPLTSGNNEITVTLQ